MESPAGCEDDLYSEDFPLFNIDFSPLPLDEGQLVEVGDGGGGERRRGARRCRTRRDVSTRNELAWLHQISEASKRQEKQELRRQIVGEALTHITQLNKLKHEYSSLEPGTTGSQDVPQSGRGHDVSYEEGSEAEHGLQRGRAGRPLKHKTPREKQSAHNRRERKRMGELVEAYKRLKKILPNSSQSHQELAESPGYDRLRSQ